MSEEDTAESVQVTLTRARALARVRRHEAAIELLRRVAHQHPGDSRVLTVLAEICLDAGDPTAAEQWSRNALGLDPTNVGALKVRAASLVGMGGREADALDLARQAVVASPDDPAARYTLVRAQLASRRRDDARKTAQQIRQVAPWSPYGPVSEALVELDASNIRRRGRLPVVAIVVFTLFTSGAFLLYVAGSWVVHAVRRAPHLRRADALIQDALAMAPDSPQLHALSAEVLAARFRFMRSGDREVAVATLDIGLADADALASEISRRTSIVAVVAFFAWVGVVAVAGDLIAADPVTAAIGVLLACVAIGGIVGIESWQTARLPRGVVRNVHGRWPLLAVAGGAIAWLMVVAPNALDGEQAGATGYHFACLWTLPVMVVATSALAIRTWRARSSVH